MVLRCPIAAALGNGGAPANIFEASELEARSFPESGEAPPAAQQPSQRSNRPVGVCAAHAAPVTMRAALGHDSEELRSSRRCFAPRAKNEPADRLKAP